MTADDRVERSERLDPEADERATSEDSSALGLKDLAVRIEDLARAVVDMARIAKSQEQVINRLHEENQKLRAGELDEALEPVLRDLIRLHDDLQKAVQVHSGGGNASAPGAPPDFEIFRIYVSDLLFRLGAECFGADQGDQFDPRQHRGLGAVPTPDERRDRTIARVVRLGFKTDRRVIRLLEAEVFRFRREEKIESTEAERLKVDEC